MPEHAVIIAGAGPTGLMLAGELALAGIDVALVERRPDQTLSGLRAGGLHARTIELLDQRGIAGRFLSEGKTAQVGGFAWNPLDISDFPTRHPYGLALWQSHIERILAGWVAEQAVPVYRGHEVTGLTQDDTGVTIATSGDLTLRARYLVGCDGGRSRVRKAAGIAFPGWDPTASHLIAEVEMTAEPPWGLHSDAHGIRSLSRMEDGVRVRVLVTEPVVVHAAAEPDMADLRAALTAVYGSDYGVHSPTSISRFTDATRQAQTYRQGRVLLAGDAAHIHAPTGGQGLNIGLHDAVNLGWKLAQVVSGASPDSLLDTYHAERHPVAARVLRDTMAQIALLRRSDERAIALAETMADLLRLDEPRRHMAGRMSGLDLRYDLGEGHPLLGRRMPDLDLVTAAGPIRVYSLLHRARPVLIDFATAPRDISPWAGRVQYLAASYDGPWDLPVLGAVSAPSAVLVRPDGYVAWVAEQGAGDPTTALTTWFGPSIIDASRRRSIHRS